MGQGFRLVLRVRAGMLLQSAYCDHLNQEDRTEAEVLHAHQQLNIRDLLTEGSSARLAASDCGCVVHQGESTHLQCNLNLQWVGN